MALQAPLHVPVELDDAPRGRWFRLADAVSEDEVRLVHVVPESLEGPLGVTFVLPGAGAEGRVQCRGRAIDIEVGRGEDAHGERRAIRFIDLDERNRSRIVNYVNERLGLFR